MRANYPPAFKAKVALEAIKEEKTTSELASQYQAYPGQIRNLSKKGYSKKYSFLRKVQPT